MKYMMIVKLNRNSQNGRNYDTGMPPDARLTEAMGKIRERMIKAGELLDTGGLLPFAQGATIRVAGGKMAVTDGPFIESKEVIGGFAILQAKSKEEAIKMGQEFMKLHIDILGPSFEAEMEVRQMYDSPMCGQQGENS
jgi:hypothetical protein